MQNLRTWVEQNLVLLCRRDGEGLARKLRQKESDEERSWYTFVHRTTFTEDEKMQIKAMDELLSQSEPQSVAECRRVNAAIEDELSIVTVNVDGYMRPSALTPADAKNTPQKKTWSPWRGARCAAKSAASPVSRALEPAACARAAAHDAGSEAGGRWKRARLGIACVTLPAWAIHHAKEPGDCTVPNPIGSVPLQGKYLRQIFQGHKLYEGRPLNSRGFRRIQHDSWFGFHCYQSWHVVVKVTDIREYADVRSMLTELGCR